MGTEAVVGAVHSFVDSPVYGCLSSGEVRRRGAARGHGTCTGSIMLEGANVRTKKGTLFTPGFEIGRALWVM